MASDKFEQALAVLDPSKRALLKRIVAGAAFVVPAISSFAVGDLASAGPACTTTIVTTLVTTGTFTVTTTSLIQQIVTLTSTLTVTRSILPTSPPPTPAT